MTDTEKDNKTEIPADTAARPRSFGGTSSGGRGSRAKPAAAYKKPAGDAAVRKEYKNGNTKSRSWDEPGKKKGSNDVPKKRKKAKKHGIFYYAMPWHLKKAITDLGYPFSAKNIGLIYIVVTLAAIIGANLFKLPIAWYAGTVIPALLFAPMLVRNSYLNKYEKKRFSDVNVYVEQMLYAFKESQKVLTALDDVSILFPEGPMREVIDEARSIIADPAMRDVEGGAERAALDVIEKRYPCTYVYDLHRFMLKVESIGGDFDSSVDLLLNIRSMWENRMHKMQDKRKQKRSTILMSCLMSILLVVLMLYVLPKEADISKNVIVRAVEVLDIVAAMWVFTKADSKLATNLISPKKVKSDEAVLRDYYKFVNYDKKKQFKMGLVMSIVPAFFLAYFLIIGKTWWAMGCIALLCITMCQHMIGHNLLKKSLTREIQKAFPQWLMELALLLQADNVQVSIFKTVDTAVAVMRPELELMRDALEKDPNSSEPFLNFFWKFQLPEVTTSMQMLYSLSVGSGGNAKQQIANIVNRNSIILDRAEEMANDDAVASLNILFLLPVIVGAVVLIVDMTVFLGIFMSNMGGL